MAKSPKKATQIKRLFPPVGLLFPSLAVSTRGQLTRMKRQWLASIGSGGALVQILNRRISLVEDYVEGGWPLVLIAMLSDKPLDTGAQKDIARKAMREAILFWKFDWRIKDCEYREKRHWYVHQPTGRPPEACPRHRNAARLARWRKSPKRKARQKQHLLNSHSGGDLKRSSSIVGKAVAAKRKPGRP